MSLRTLFCLLFTGEVSLYEWLERYILRREKPICSSQSKVELQAGQIALKLYAKYSVYRYVIFLLGIKFKEFVILLKFKNSGLEMNC